MSNETPCLLVVEEESVLRDITSFRLELLGYEVVSCATANEAVN